MDTLRNNPELKCWMCGIEVEDVNYIFCSIECQTRHVLTKEKRVGFNVDLEVYKQWLIGKTEAIEAMTTTEEIQKRIEEIREIEFYAKAEWAVLANRWDKIKGRNSIAPWLKGDRDKLITDPNIKVNWEGDPRKKEKKPKVDLAEQLLGINVKDMVRELKHQGKIQSQENEKPVKTKAVKMDDMSILLAPSTPKVVVPKATEEEVKAKAEAMKERMRLAKLAKETK
jgi:hypothetical protein